MKKTILLGIFALAFALSSTVKAEMSLSGYAEFYAGSADQSIASVGTNAPTSAHAQDKAGMDNGTYTRVTAGYSSTMDNGIDVNGTMNVSTRDCQGDKVDVCNVVDFNFVTFSGGFGAVSVGERFAAGHAMMSRLTASGPSGEPDGGNLGAFYHAANASHNYGRVNEVNYADNSMKVLYSSNVYSGFSFAASYAPNTRNTGLASTRQGQPTAASNGAFGNFNDLVSVFGKYAMDIDGIGIELVYGQQIGNAGVIGTTNYNDLDETAYSALVTYGNFKVDYRKNEQGNSGRPKNDGSGNDEGTSVCATYTMGNLGVGACDLDSSFTDSSNLTNTASTTTFSAQYNLGGGVSLAATYFDVEQESNSVVDTDADGIAARLAVGF
ncbi:MAG: hypothetical protein CBD74_14175 [Saprospirales bacterium TMED214]|nr:MAG: hypothetical protein CBD74_14175 [Saprospirales bacterium TMED214]